MSPIPMARSVSTSSTRPTATASTTRLRCTAIPAYTCHDSPWWLPGNALHGHEYETDAYASDGLTLLNKSTTQYSVTCPPTGVVARPAYTAWGNWNGNLVSELDHNNPVASCEIRTTQTDQYTYDGAASGPHTTTTHAYNVDSATGFVKSHTQTTTVNGGTNGSPTIIVTVDSYSWNNALSPTYSGVTGTYLNNFQTEHYVEDSGNTTHYACDFTYYDNGSFAVGQTSGLTAGSQTATQSYTGCGASSNSFALTGLIESTFTYDSFGDQVASKDPDAIAGISGHTGCTVNSATYTTCAVFDTAYHTLPVASTNVMNQTTTTGYTSAASGGFGLWPTSNTDFNSQVTSFSYDALGRMTSKTLPNETPGDTTTSWTYTDWCTRPARQTPCLELDQAQRVDSSTTVISRAFYDGFGNLIETRNPGPSGSDVITFAEYDASDRRVFESNSYLVTAYTGAPGAAAFSAPLATEPGSITAYDSAGRVASVTGPALQRHNDDLPDGMWSAQRQRLL